MDNRIGRPTAAVPETGGRTASSLPGGRNCSAAVIRESLALLDPLVLASLDCLMLVRCLAEEGSTAGPLHAVETISAL